MVEYIFIFGLLIASIAALYYISVLAHRHINQYNRKQKRKKDYSEEKLPDIKPSMFLHPTIRDASNEELYNEVARRMLEHINKHSTNDNYLAILFGVKDEELVGYSKKTYLTEIVAKVIFSPRTRSESLILILKYCRTVNQLLGVLTAIEETKNGFERLR